MKGNPTLDDFDLKLRSFGGVDVRIGNNPDIQNIGALSLRTVSIKAQLKVSVMSICFNPKWL